MSVFRIALAAAGLALGAATASAEVLDTIKQRGTLIVGTKADYRPFGFRDPSGAIVGIEPGTFLRARGRVAEVRGVPTIFNPAYEIVPTA